MQVTAYYNEIDPFAADWLRNLIMGGLLPEGDVDERDIWDVCPEDLRGYTQCHFFAGIGGWPLALSLADWPVDRPVWTGSCPCQPFSQAGARRGFADERHHWPALYHLARECRPPVCFGEQVASPDGLEWLDLVQADLEIAGYAFAAVDMGAAGVSAPHIRQRLWWVADANDEVKGGRRVQRLGESDSASTWPSRQRPPGFRPLGRLADRDHSGLEGRGFGWDGSGRWIARPGVLAGAWDDAEWIACSDGKSRPVGAGVRVLAHGIPGRVGRLRGYGNAIVPQVGAKFIKAFLDTETRR